jgi:predicted short-subunit dehydrogenase-like oxidoreductase (DUF2520 family)
MTNIIARIALPIVSAGVLGGAALGLAGMASAQTTTVDHSTGTAIVSSPDTYAKPAPNVKPGWRHHHGIGHSYLNNR